MKTVLYAIVALLTICTLGCKKEQKGLAKSPALQILLQHDGQRLSDAVLNEVTLYYIEIPDRKVYVKDFGRAAGTGYQRGVLATSDVIALSADAAIKNYYMHYPDGSQDTLLIDYQSISDKEARENKCYCNKPLINFLVNGKAPVMGQSSADGTPVYVIYK